MYQIETDRRRNLIAVTLGGMLSVGEVAAYIAELRERFRAERFTAGYRILIDVDACCIQSQAMIEAMREHMVRFPKASRIAMATGSSLARMQVKRLMTQPYARVFESRAEGLAWLVAPDMEAERRSA